MGCGSCGTGGGCSPKGCKNNGTCNTGGCNKLNVYDWLGDMEQPNGYKPFDVVEVRFKGSRKEFYRNDSNFELFIGDSIVVQAENGYDYGHVSLSGELVRLQLKKHGVDADSPNMFKIYRRANEKDTEKYDELKAREAYTLERARTVALELNLQMKLSDIEFHGDGRKVTFFYTAEERVDFRELIKRYAEEFKVRIEMKQIGYRQEAARLGGIGSCGRELCCSTWLTDFKLVNTSAARYQNLSINMLKLSGQCGRLKCCLNYELDTYLEALSDFPKGDNVTIETEVGYARSQKTDILKRQMWFVYENSTDWFPLDIKKVNEIIALNREGKKGEILVDTPKGTTALQRSMDEDIISENDLTRLDKGNNRRDNNRRNNNNNRRREDRGSRGNVVNGGSNTNNGNNNPRNPNPQNNRGNNEPRDNGGERTGNNEGNNNNRRRRKKK
jgi:cell fate regulator YaaT (PSP1 superfamily)